MIILFFGENELSYNFGVGVGVRISVGVIVDEGIKVGVFVGMGVGTREAAWQAVRSNPSKTNATIFSLFSNDRDPKGFEDL
jgi:hypothetical protein